MAAYTAKVTSKGQVTIPKALREELGIEEGDYLLMENEDGRLVARPSAIRPTEDFEELADRIAERFEEKGITRDEVEDAIRWARDRS